MFQKILLPAMTAALLSGCMGDGNQRIQGLTSGAGNAIAANTVMQMVDPWQAGVEETDLITPAQRPSKPAAAASPDVAKTNN
jgi:hypothetical protein